MLHLYWCETTMVHNLCGTDCEADWILWTNTFPIALRLGSISVDNWTLSRTDISVQNPVVIYEVNYMTKLVFGVPRVRLVLLGPFILSETRNVNRHFTRSDTIFEHLFNCKRFCVFFHKPVPTILCVVFRKCFLWQNNKQGSVASSIVRYGPGQSSSTYGTCYR